MPLARFSKAIAAFVGAAAGWGVSQFGGEVMIPQEVGNIVGMLLPVFTTYFAPKNAD